jgi:hypothetical protein
MVKLRSDWGVGTGGDVVSVVLGSGIRVLASVDVSTGVFSMIGNREQDERRITVNENKRMDREMNCLYFIMMFSDCRKINGSRTAVITSVRENG